MLAFLLAEYQSYLVRMLILNPNLINKEDRFPIRKKQLKHTAGVVESIFRSARRQVSFWDEMFSHNRKVGISKYSGDGTCSNGLSILALIKKSTKLARDLEQSL
jgi:hypothetical protein